MAADPSRRGTAAVLAVVSVAAALAACSSPSAPVAASARASESAPGSSATASASVPSPVPPASTGPGSSTGSAAPTPLDRTATPATTSGALGPTSLPFARTLGPRWTARVDPGSVEDGYTGNGTPVVARDARDVAQALLPLGCADEAVYATAMPVPRHALEADYSYAPTGAHAVGLVLDYGDAAAAQRFVRVYTAALRRCTAGAGGSMVVSAERAPGAGLFVSRQVDPVSHETWRELVAPAGRVVRLIAVEGASTPLRPWSAIAAALPAA